MASRRMKTTPAMACLKTLLTIFSLIFLVIGLAFLVAGILAKVKFIMFDELSTTNFSTAPWVMIGIGCFIILVGIVGCSATIKGNTCLLRTYGLLLGIIFICELAGAIVAIVFRGQVNAGFENGMQIALKNYTTDKEAAAAFDQAQTTGCHTEMQNAIFNNLAVVIGTMFGVAFFQLIGLVLACCLASSINANKYELV